MDLQKNFNFQMATETHRRLKVLSAELELTLGGTIRRLLDAYEGKPDFRSPAYKQWLSGVISASQEAGEEGAQKYMELNPYMG